MSSEISSYVIVLAYNLEMSGFHAYLSDTHIDPNATASSSIGTGEIRIMNVLDQKICAWGGPFCAVFLGAGLVLAGFVPPPSPTLSADQIAAVYQSDSIMIRTGMLLGLTGIAGYIALVGAISVQMRRMQGISRLPAYLQVGAGSIGVLTVMFPIMIFAATAFRPERDPQLTQMLNDLGWLMFVPAFPTFIAQLLAIAFGTLQDKSRKP